MTIQLREAYKMVLADVQKRQRRSEQLAKDGDAGHEILRDELWDAEELLEAILESDD